MAYSGIRKAAAKATPWYSLPRIRRKFPGSPTFVILTDREELNKQISDTFEACGCLGNLKAKQFIASSGEDLIAKLKGNPSFIFTLIQKFNDPEAKPIIPDHDIIILSDEAHRTQNGIFADNMCRMLPTASRIGFTGTPLFIYDNITERTFGGYVSIYDFKRAVEDNATVPLYYENRADLLHINNPEINDELIEAIEANTVCRPLVTNTPVPLSHSPLVTFMMSCSLLLPRTNICSQINKTPFIVCFQRLDSGYSGKRIIGRF